MLHRALLLVVTGLAAPAAARAARSSMPAARGRRSTAARCARRCRAPQKVMPKDKVQPIAGISFTADRRRWGEFHARLSRMPRGDATVMLQIGGQPYLLVARGGWAWSRGPAQAQAIIDALRNATEHEHRQPRRGGRALHRPLSARRRADRDRRRSRALRASRRWQNPVTHLDSAPRHECRHQPDAHSGATTPCPWRGQ